MVQSLSDAVKPSEVTRLAHAPGQLHCSLSNFLQIDQSINGQKTIRQMSRVNASVFLNLLSYQFRIARWFLF